MYICAAQTNSLIGAIMASHFYRGVPLISHDELLSYKWQVNRIIPKLPVAFGKDQDRLGCCEIYLEERMWSANLWIDVAWSSYYLREYRLEPMLSGKRIEGVILTPEQKADYNTMLFNHASIEAICTCGAEYTTTPQYHLDFCQLYKRTT